MSAPRGFVVSARNAFDAAGNARYERATTRLLLNVIASRGIGEIVGSCVAAYYPQKLVFVNPDTNPCDQWRRNAHARQLIVGAPGSSVDLGSEILFRPRCWSPDGIYAAKAVLIHELVHAIRQLTGSWTGGGAVGVYPNQEEFHAVTVANVFRSQLGLPLRLGYVFGDRAFEALVNRLMPASQQPQPSTTPQMGSGGGGLSANFLEDRILNPAPSREDLRWFSAVFAAYHPSVRLLLNETSILAAPIARLSWESAPFNPYRALGNE